MKNQNVPEPSTDTKNTGNIPEIIIPRPDMATSIIPYEMPLNTNSTEKQTEK